ncbi:class I SAM-dependent methyltransferase [Paenibacillus abyssi]|uniref:Methyltransferase n=1 Tax=Paenibacillus abyssi TaxID=1340531 RepID=A0A917CR33_9BACL|nr:class I SAM-dependent methyltransferase [Paenibacillus abyssi]GGF95053.1 methyltransferase [Paenibacillus abyssi]
MNASRLQRIRKEERKYHEQCFENVKLYQKGTWLHEPVDLVMDHFDYLQTDKPLSILDLGCGVGRHSIPLADKVRVTGGYVQCVDLLEKALEKLNQYSRRYGVDDAIRTEQGDISDYQIQENSYDYIVAGSSLEHVRSEDLLQKVLQRMAKGTREKGINCILMNTNIKEFNKKDGTERETLFEVILDKEKALSAFRREYKGWKELHVGEEPLELEINRDKEPVILKAVSLSYIVQKP